jgi:hypothetical protein
VKRIPRPIGALLLACAAAACGRAAEHAPSRLAADTVVPATVRVSADTMTISSGDPLAVPTVTLRESPDPDPEPRPGAVGCRRAGTRPPPNAGIVDGVRAGARFSCVLREGHPPVEARVDVDGSGYLAGMEISASTWTRPWSQSLAAESIEERTPYVEALDYDNDGWADLRTIEWTGATGNIGYHVFRFHPDRHRFERDSVLSALSGADPLPGRPCARGYVKNGGRSYDTRTLCRERGRWVEVASESRDNPDGKPFYVHVSRERRGGRMVVVRTDTLTANEVWGYQ